MNDFFYRPLTGVLKFLLSILELPFLFLVKFRIWLYEVKLLSRYKSTAKVISVGNITMGGTGKSPMVSWLVDYLEQNNLKVAVLTRGYRSGGSEKKIKFLSKDSVKGGADFFGDEPWMLHLRHPNISLFVGKKRVDSAQIAEKEADILLLDDGFQHVKLDRDIEIALVDSTRGFGNGCIMPFGPLREPKSALHRADLVILTKSNLPTALDISAEVARELNPNAKIVSSVFEPEALLSSRGGEVGLDFVRDKRCFIASTIANPASFRTTLEELGAKVEQHLVLPDHQEYGKKELELFYSNLDEGLIFVVSEKDWVKLQENSFELPEFYWLKMKNKLPEEFKTYLDELLHKPK